MFTIAFGSEKPLFQNTRWAKDFLWELVQKIGPLPDAWGLDDILLNPPTSAIGFKNPPKSPDEYWEERLNDYDGPWTPEITKGFLKLIRRMLCLDHTLRPSMESVLADEWFDDIRARVQ
jgi:serine/threonine protein kinase